MAAAPIPVTDAECSGSLRYEGYPEFAKVLVDLGFLKDEEQPYCKEAAPWNEVFQKILGAASSSEKDLVAAVDSKVTFKDAGERQRILAGLRWLGLFSTENVSAPWISFVPFGRRP